MRKARKTRTVDFLVPVAGQAYEISFPKGNRIVSKKGQITMVSKYGIVFFQEIKPVKRRTPFVMFISDDKTEGGYVTRWLIHIDGTFRNVASVSWDEHYHYNLQRANYVRGAIRNVQRAR